MTAPRTRAPRSEVRLARLVSVVLAGAVGCAADVEASERSEARAFRAGVAQADLTPPPGLPHFGHSTEGTKRAIGYWTRLYARAFVLIDGQGSKVALVQLDLGASSLVLHREVLEALRDLHYGPEELVLLSSHTHAGPGGYLSARFYNRLGAARCGFDPEIVRWLSERIARAVREAHQSAEPALVAFDQVEIPGVARNRSLLAWRRNFPFGRPTYTGGLIPSFWLLRIDRERREASAPIGALAFLPLHATAVEAKSRYYHADIHGVVARRLKERIARAYEEAEEPVVGAAAGPEGDVSPDWFQQGEAEARRLGEDIADELGRLFVDLDDDLTTPRLGVSYSLGELPGAAVTGGALCERAAIGMATMAGAEDGRSFIYGHLGFVEGNARKKPKGCHGRKKTALGLLQRLIAPQSHFPRYAPLHLVRLGELGAIATVPGEPTTETARRLRMVLEAELGVRATVAAHGTDYVSYFTTEEEYGAQHYEGASTLWGPRTQVFLAESLQKLAAGTHASAETPQLRPGRAKKMLPRKPCDAASWHAFPSRNGPPRKAGEPYLFEWRGLAKGHLCATLPRVSAHCDYTDGSHREADSDEGLAFHVSREGRSRWSAKWDEAAFPSDAVQCRIRVERAVNLGGPIESDPFSR